MSMPIILAIEPDRRQAAHVSAVVRHRVGAELILAETTEGALDAIGSRVPDLVLVPALLSPQDDAALAAALRVIAAAAHVRTLTIPVFSNGTSNAQGGGLLARFRRGRSDTTSVGCDPAVFAEQITDYLREAAAERADVASASEAADEPAPMAARVFEAPAAVTAPAHDVFESSVVAAFEAPVPIAHPEPPPIVREAPVVFEAAAAPLDFFEDAAELFADRAVTRETTPDDDEPADDEIVIDLSDDIVEISPETSSEQLFDGEPFGVYTLSLDDTLDTSVDAVARLAKIEKEPEAVEPAEAVEEIDAPAPIAAIEAVAEMRAAADVATPMRIAPIATEKKAAPIAAETRIERPDHKHSDDAAWVSLGLRYTRQWPVLEGVLVEAATPLAEAAAAPVKKVAAVDAAAPPAASVVASTPAPPAPPSRPDHLEWAELVASLRQDIERRRRQPITPAVVAAPPTEARPRMHAAEAAQSRRARTKAGTPIQDEWGFFDPQQCGFAALLAKLDEFSDGPDEPTARPPAA
jgi:hypothetical protein